jgi:hypothetical protein
MVTIRLEVLVQIESDSITPAMINDMFEPLGRGHTPLEESVNKAVADLVRTAHPDTDGVGTSVRRM